MRLECYLIDEAEIDIRPAERRRDWMDQTFQKAAYQCLPLTIANTHGWVVCCAEPVEAEWDGGKSPEDVEVITTGDQPFAEGHFGSGVLTLHHKAIFKTEPGYNLYITGPSNEFKDGIQAMSAVVETDWMPFTFTMNWKFTRPNQRVRFEKGEPYCGEFTKTLGADLVINTRKEDFVERVKAWTGGAGADVVIDNLGGDVLAKSIEATRPMGVIVAFGCSAGPEVKFDIRSLFFAQKQLRGSMASDIEDLQWGLQQVRAGTIRPSLDRQLPLSQAAEAHRLISTNQVTGNLVLLPWTE